MARDRSGSAEKYHIVVDERLGTGHALSLDLTGRDRRVLELGCAAGHVTTALKARGHSVVGVEIDPVSAEKARDVADVVHTADLDRDALPDVVTERDFDVVLMGDVLEHLRDPLTVLQEAVGLLAPDGFAVASIPNIAFFDVRMALLDGDWTYRSDGLLDETHLRFFTRRSLFDFARRAGLVVTELRRVTKQPGTSNVAPRDPVIGEAVRDALLLDPNATTYVFVVKLERPTSANEAAARELDETLTAEEDIAFERLRGIVGLRAEEIAALQQSREELIALRNTKLMRAAAFPRRLYGRLRRTISRRR